MCGRCETDVDLTEELERLGIVKKGGRGVQIPMNVDVRPTNPIPIVRNVNGENDLSLARWSIVPFWAKDEKAAGYSLFNTRMEDVETKRSFSQSFKRRRCLIVARAYFEWVMRENRKNKNDKQKYRVAFPDRAPLLFAGIWDSWTNPETGEIIESTSMMMREAEGRRLQT
jgi:putative SOS response-associated peptidase YedK